MIRPWRLVAVAAPQQRGQAAPELRVAEGLAEHLVIRVPPRVSHARRLPQTLVQGGKIDDSTGNHLKL